MHRNPGHLKSNHWLPLSTILFMFVSGAVSQPPPGYSISGHVRDRAANEPIFNVNVFLSGTTKGSTTDQAGYYEIKNIPPGEYQLVASMMGYRRRVHPVYLHTERSVVKNIALEPHIYEGETIRVTAGMPKDWKKNLKRFKKLFLGESAFASKCTILNPEVLRLDYDKEIKKLEADALRPLFIENRALGYKIEMVLDDFYYSQQPFFLSYSHNEVFTEMEPKNSRQEKRWNKNRQKVYYGSLRHFLMTLYRGENALDHNGYEMFLLKPHGHPPFKKYRHFKVTADSLVRDSRLRLAKRLSVPDPLKVVYLNEDNDRSRFLPTVALLKKYNQSAGAYYDLPGSDVYQTSVISLKKDVIINEYGGIYESKNFYVVAGYWMGDRIAELLPRDYVPVL